jgi:hypothetical protein
MGDLVFNGGNEFFAQILLDLPNSSLSGKFGIWAGSQQ